MTEYCSRTDVENRITTQGLSYFVDRDLDGDNEEAELAAYVDTAIQEAGVMVDMHLHHFIKPSAARAAANVWLRMICVDLAVERLARIGGNDPPVSVVFDAERSRRYLMDIKAGRFTVPNLTYPTPTVPTGYEVPYRGRVVNP